MSGLGKDHWKRRDVPVPRSLYILPAWEDGVGKGTVGSEDSEYPGLGEEGVKFSDVSY